MKQILVTCVFFLVLLFAILGCLYIFGIVSFSEPGSAALKFSAAIVLLGGCAALLTRFFSGPTEERKDS